MERLDNYWQRDGDVSDQERANHQRSRRRRRRTGDPALGLRVRKARIKAGLSQEQAAHQIERSDRWLLLVENGRADPGYGDLLRLAPVLNVAFDQLVLNDQGTRQEGGRVASIVQQVVTTPLDDAMMNRGDLHVDGRWVDELRRRGFLQAGLVVTGGMVLGLWPAIEDGTESPEMTSLRRALLHYGRETVSERPDLGMLRTALQAARSDLQASRYSPVLRTVSSLVTNARFAANELDGQERVAGHELLAHAYRVAFNLFRKLGDSRLATIAADRGMQAAHVSGNPALVADLAGCLCVVLSDGHHFDEALDLCTATAAQVKPDAMGRRDPASLSIYGQLLLSGAEAAALAANDRVCDDFYQEAEHVARLLGGDANHSFTAFGPTNILVHRVHAAIVLGNGERAVRLARNLDLTRLPVLERQAHHLMDVAIAYGVVENAEAAVTTLLAAEEIAPEEVRLDPGAQALAEELRRRTRQRGSQLEALAARMRGSSNPG